MSLDMLCLSTAKAKYQSRQVLLSTDARKLYDAHNPESMEASIMDCFLRFCYCNIVNICNKKLEHCEHLNLCKCTSLNIKNFKYKGLYGH